MRLKEELRRTYQTKQAKFPLHLLNNTKYSIFCIKQFLNVKTALKGAVCLTVPVKKQQTSESRLAQSVQIDGMNGMRYTSTQKQINA